MGESKHTPRWFSRGKLKAGTRVKRTDGGAIATVWLGWLPDMDGHAEAIAERYRWPLSPTGHNTEIGVSIGHHTERVPVAAVANWTEVP